MAAVYFNALVLETIDRCNAKCAMCYQAAGPRGSDIRGDGHLPLDVTLRVIDEAAELEEVGDRVHISGGEAFLQYEEVKALARRARSRGFSTVSATTNAFWATNDTSALRRCRELAEAGFTYFEVSMDFWHLPYVSLERVRCLVRAARKAGLRIVLRTLSSRSHPIGELFETFTDDELLHVSIGNGRVQPVGRGAETVPIEDVYLGKGAVGACDKALNLTITPNGNIYPCCASADMTEALAFGNVHRDTLAGAILKMRTDQMIRALIHKGTAALVPILEKLGFADRLLPAYGGICHMCWDIFRDNEMADALRKHFQEEQLELFKRMLVDIINAEAARAAARPPVVELDGAAIPAA